VVPQRQASRGFAWAGIDRIDSYPRMNGEMVDQPRDIFAALDRVASAPPPGLEGLIDVEHAGAMGYSFDGYNALALSGARIDPGCYLAQCPKPDATTAAIVGQFHGACGRGDHDEHGRPVAADDGQQDPCRDADGMRGTSCRPRTCSSSTASETPRRR
jgi:predicted dienelactone hydrolase